MVEVPTIAVPSSPHLRLLGGLLVLAGLFAAVGLVVWQFLDRSLATALLAIATLLVVAVYLKVFEIVVQRYPDHPISFGLLAIGGHLALLGLALERVLGHEVAGAFLVIYALLAGFLGASGYAIVVAARVFSRTRRRIDTR